MTKQINQDITAYKDSFFKGLSLRETMYGGTALMSGVAIPMLLYLNYNISVNISMTLCIPLIGLLGYVGFYEKNGMTLPTILKKWIQLHQRKPLVYRSRQEVEKENSKKNGWLNCLLTGRGQKT